MLRVGMIGAGFVAEFHRKSLESVRGVELAGVYALKGAVGEVAELWDIFRGCFFFLALWLVDLLILIFFPQISLWLPALMKG